MVSIIDYGLGNLASVKKALDFLGISNEITSSIDTIKNSDAIILPGVGSFYQGITNLRESGLDKVLTEEVFEKKKLFVGICLGMQLIFENSEESPGIQGLGWIPGSVIKIKSSTFRIPHMGWNDISFKNGAFNDSKLSTDYYFIHSYHCVPEDGSIITSTVNYGEELVSSINLDNIYSFQFHPEKSQLAGLALLKLLLEKHA